MHYRISTCLIPCCPAWSWCRSGILFPRLFASRGLCLCPLAFKNSIGNVLYTRYWVTLCNECTYLSKRGWWRSISYRGRVSWISRGHGMRFGCSMMLRLDPTLVGLEVDRCLELPGTEYQNKSERKRVRKVSPCVIITTSSNGQMCGLLGSSCRPQNRGESSLKFIVATPVIVV